MSYEVVNMPNDTSERDYKSPCPVCGDLILAGQIYKHLYWIENFGYQHTKKLIRIHVECYRNIPETSFKFVKNHVPEKRGRYAR